MTQTKYPIRKRIIETLAVSGASIFMTWCLTFHLHACTPASPLFWQPFDHWTYIYMAGHPFERFGMAPFGWRVLAPWAIGVLDAGEKGNYFQNGFWLLAKGGVILGGIASYGIGKRLWGSVTHGLVAWCWFWSFYWTTKAPLELFVYLDAATYGVTAALIYLILSRRDTAFWIALAVGAAFKESVLFVWPLYYTLRVSGRAFDRSLASKAVFGLLPALAVLLVLRVTSPPHNNDAAYRATLPVLVRQTPDIQITYALPIIFKMVMRRRAHDLSLIWLGRLTLGTFGMAALIMTVLGIFVRPEFALRWSPLLLLAWAQLLLALNDERLLVIAFPAVVALIGAATIWLQERWKAPTWSFAILPFVLWGQNVLPAIPHAGSWGKFQVAASTLVFLPLLIARFVPERA